MRKKKKRLTITDIEESFWKKRIFTSAIFLEIAKLTCKIFKLLQKASRNTVVFLTYCKSYICIYLTYNHN